MRLVFVIRFFVKQRQKNSVNISNKYKLRKTGKRADSFWITWLMMRNVISKSLRIFLDDRTHLKYACKFAYMIEIMLKYNNWPISDWRRIKCYRIKFIYCLLRSLLGRGWFCVRCWSSTPCSGALFISSISSKKIDKYPFSREKYPWKAYSWHRTSLRSWHQSWYHNHSWPY